MRKNYKLTSIDPNKKHRIFVEVKNAKVQLTFCEGLEDYNWLILSTVEIFNDDKDELMTIYENLISRTGKQLYNKFFKL